MEKKFGTFNSIAELNRAAAAQKAEGDYEALEALALENGLDREDAEEYFYYDEERLCSPLMAAMGKLELEEQELDLKSQLKDWKDAIVSMCSESDMLCEAVFSPGKHLVEILGKALKACSDNRVSVSSKIIKAAGLPSSAASIGMIGRDDFRRLVMKYYMGGTV